MGEVTLPMFLLYCTVLFFIIYGAVAMAIKPLVKEEEEKITEDSLMSMMEFNIINSQELEEITQVYERIGFRKAQRERYEKYAKVLGELKEIGHFSEEEYNSKISGLKEYFDIE